MTDVDPTDSVRALLEEATSPLSTAQIAQSLVKEHGEHEVAEALDFWRREQAVVRDADGNWIWQGPGLG